MLSEKIIFLFRKRSIGFSMLFAKVNVFLKVVGGAKISTIFAPRSFQIFHVICFFDVHCTLTKMEHESSNLFLLAFYSEPIFERYIIRLILRKIQWSVMKSFDLKGEFRFSIYLNQCNRFQPFIAQFCVFKMFSTKTFPQNTSLDDFFFCSMCF